jgi:hypothetical protein
MTTKLRRVFQTLPLLGMLAATLGPANAALLQVNANEPYLCVVVQGNSTAPGTPIIDCSCSGDFADQSNYFNGQLVGIGSANGTSMCLTVVSTIQLFPCTGTANQQWVIQNGAIVNPATGDCLDFKDSTIANNTPLVPADCKALQSQNWIVR